MGDEEMYIKLWSKTKRTNDLGMKPNFEDY